MVSCAFFGVHASRCGEGRSVSRGLRAPIGAAGPMRHYSLLGLRGHASRQVQRLPLLADRRPPYASYNRIACAFVIVVVESRLCAGAVLIADRSLPAFKIDSAPRTTLARIRSYLYDSI